MYYTLLILNRNQIHLLCIYFLIQNTPSPEATASAPAAAATTADQDHDSFVHIDLMQTDGQRRHAETPQESSSTELVKVYSMN